MFRFPEPPVRWRGPVKNSDFVVSNSVNNNGNGGGPPKKPSYVGLSCSVSGYGPANRYTSPDGRRTSPEQIPVGKPPQILDSVGLVLNSMRQQGGNSMHILHFGLFWGGPFLGHFLSWQFRNVHGISFSRSLLWYYSYLGKFLGRFLKYCMLNCHSAGQQQ